MNEHKWEDVEVGSVGVNYKGEKDIILFDKTDDQINAYHRGKNDYWYSQRVFPFEDRSLFPFWNAGYLTSLDSEIK